jgi:hypothetical protein
VKDNCGTKLRKDHAPENFALLRRLALNLLKQEKTFKGSLKMKRYKASMDNDYLTQILASSASQLLLNQPQTVLCSS